MQWFDNPLESANERLQGSPHLKNPPIDKRNMRNSNGTNESHFTTCRFIQAKEDTRRRNTTKHCEHSCALLYCAAVCICYVSIDLGSLKHTPVWLHDQLIMLSGSVQCAR